jgi:ATP adenylyltransferase
LDYVKSGLPPAADLPQPEPTLWLDGADRDCFLCRAAANYDASSSVMRRLLVVDRGGEVIVVLNRYPYNNGHVLIAPARHVGELDSLSSAEHVRCMQQIARLIRTIERSMQADGFNVGLNLGRAAGAGLPGHLHWHVVPRWIGDHNFMPVLADVRVIPQSLEALWELLTSELAANTG